jgi:hypothetical protein
MLQRNDRDCAWLASARQQFVGEGYTVDTTYRVIHWKCDRLFVLSPLRITVFSTVLITRQDRILFFSVNEVLTFLKSFAGVEKPVNNIVRTGEGKRPAKPSSALYTCRYSNWRASKTVAY